MLDANECLLSGGSEVEEDVRAKVMYESLEVC